MKLQEEEDDYITENKEKEEEHPPLEDAKPIGALLGFPEWEK